MLQTLFPLYLKCQSLFSTWFWLGILDGSDLESTVWKKLLIIRNFNYTYNLYIMSAAPCSYRIDIKLNELIDIKSRKNILIWLN